MEGTKCCLNLDQQSFKWISKLSCVPLPKHKIGLNAWFNFFKLFKLLLKLSFFFIIPSCLLKYSNVDSLNFFNKNIQMLRFNFSSTLQYFISGKRNWVFATNSDILIPVSLQPVNVIHCYFKSVFFDLAEICKLYNIGFQR